MHKEIIYENEASDTIVFFIHGFMGSPDLFREMAAQIYGDGLSVCTLLLPGHGCAWREFIKSSVSLWDEKVRLEVARFSKKYKKIILVGHSMGGLLSLLASIGSERVHGVITVFSPIFLRLFCPRNIVKLMCVNRRAEHGRLLSSLAGKLGITAEVIEKYRMAYGITHSPLWAYPLYLAPSIHLLRLMQKTKKALKNVTAPLVIFGSKNDETVALRSANYIYKHAASQNKRLAIVDSSWHAFIGKDDWAQIRDAIKAIA